ncbi:MAG TPA: hypothetical protein VGO52_20225, partial [Hyphomonadaceae bacterium]|nr:hypothetical protein [Hyphomonadaceae bacterium]
ACLTGLLPMQIWPTGADNRLQPFFIRSRIRGSAKQTRPPINQSGPSRAQGQIGDPHETLVRITQFKNKENRARDPGLFNALVLG